MDINTEITIDGLNQRSVSILKQQYIDLNGVKTQVGDNVRQAYCNSVLGRKALTTYESDTVITAVLTVWGDTPVVEEEITESK